MSRLPLSDTRVNHHWGIAKDDPLPRSPFAIMNAARAGSPVSLVPSPVTAKAASAFSQSIEAIRARLQAVVGSIDDTVGGRPLSSCSKTAEASGSEENLLSFRSGLWAGATPALHSDVETAPVEVTPPTLHGGSAFRTPPPLLPNRQVTGVPGGAAHHSLRRDAGLGRLSASAAPLFNGWSKGTNATAVEGRDEYVFSTHPEPSLPRSRKAAPPLHAIPAVSSLLDSRSGTLSWGTDDTSTRQNLPGCALVDDDLFTASTVLSLPPPASVPTLSARLAALRAADEAQRCALSRDLRSGAADRALFSTTATPHPLKGPRETAALGTRPTRTEQLVNSTHFLRDEVASPHRRRPPPRPHQSSTEEYHASLPAEGSSVLVRSPSSHALKPSSEARRENRASRHHEVVSVISFAKQRQEALEEAWRGAQQNISLPLEPRILPHTAFVPLPASAASSSMGLPSPTAALDALQERMLSSRLELGSHSKGSAHPANVWMSEEMTVRERHAARHRRDVGIVGDAEEAAHDDTVKGQSSQHYLQVRQIPDGSEGEAPSRASSTPPGVATPACEVNDAELVSARATLDDSLEVATRGDVFFIHQHAAHLRRLREGLHGSAVPPFPDTSQKGLRTFSGSGGDAASVDSLTETSTLSIPTATPSRTRASPSPSTPTPTRRGTSHTKKDPLHARPSSMHDEAVDAVATTAADIRDSRRSALRLGTALASPTSSSSPAIKRETTPEHYAGPGRPIAQDGNGVEKSGTGKLVGGGAPDVSSDADSTAEEWVVTSTQIPPSAPPRPAPGSPSTVVIESRKSSPRSISAHDKRRPPPSPHTRSSPQQTLSPSRGSTTASARPGRQRRQSTVKAQSLRSVSPAIAAASLATPRSSRPREAPSIDRLRGARRDRPGRAAPQRPSSPMHTPLPQRTLQSTLPHAGLTVSATDDAERDLLSSPSCVSSPGSEKADRSGADGESVPSERQVLIRDVQLRVSAKRGVAWQDGTSPSDLTSSSSFSAAASRSQTPQLPSNGKARSSSLPAQVQGEKRGTRGGPSSPASRHASPASTRPSGVPSQAPSPLPRFRRGERTPTTPTAVEPPDARRRALEVEEDRRVAQRAQVLLTERGLAVTVQLPGESIPSLVRLSRDGGELLFLLDRVAQLPPPPPSPQLSTAVSSAASSSEWVPKIAAGVSASKRSSRPNGPTTSMNRADLTTSEWPLSPPSGPSYLPPPPPPRRRTSPTAARTGRDEATAPTASPQRHASAVPSTGHPAGLSSSRRGVSPTATAPVRPMHVRELHHFPCAYARIYVPRGVMGYEADLGLGGPQTWEDVSGILCGPTSFEVLRRYRCPLFAESHALQHAPYRVYIIIPQFRRIDVPQDAVLMLLDFAERVDWVVFLLGMQRPMTHSHSAPGKEEKGSASRPSSDDRGKGKCLKGQRLLTYGRALWMLAAQRIQRARALRGLNPFDLDARWGPPADPPTRSENGGDRRSRDSRVDRVSSNTAVQQAPTPDPRSAVNAVPQRRFAAPAPPLRSSPILHTARGGAPLPDVAQPLRSSSSVSSRKGPTSAVLYREPRQVWGKGDLVQRLLTHSSSCNGGSEGGGSQKGTRTRQDILLPSRRASPEAQRSTVEILPSSIKSRAFIC